MEDKRIKINPVPVAVLMIFVAVGCAAAVFNIKMNSETSEPDLGKMQEYNTEAAEEVFDFMKKDDGDLKVLFEETYGSVDDEMNAELESFQEYTDWSEIEFDSARSLGGALIGDSEKEYGFSDQLNYGEMWVLEGTDETFVVYIECSYDEFGKNRRGLSAVAVTTWDNYFESDDLWDYKYDKGTVRIGEFG